MMSNYVKKVICDLDEDVKSSKRKRVKIRRSGTCDDDSRYIGIYKGRVYAISTDIELVRDYMRIHRKLKDEEFTIALKDTSDLQVASNLDCELVEYHNLYVADRDVIMSKLFMKDVKSELRDMQTSLISMSRLICQPGKKDEDVKVLLKAYKVLDKIRNDAKYVEELEEVSELDNHFIYSDMETYNHLLGQYEIYFNAFSNLR